MQQENQISDLIDRGLDLHQKGRLEDAQVFYEQALKIKANDFDALQLLGALLVQTKQFKKAVDCLTKALQIRST